MVMSSDKVFPAIKDVTSSLLSKLPRAIFSWIFLSWTFGHFGALDWRFELATHFQLQYLFGAVAFGIFFAATKQWRWLGAASLCALISGASVIPWYVPAPQTASGQRIRLLFSNIFADNKQFIAFLDLVRAENPDLIFMQEVRSPWEKIIEKIRADYPHGLMKGFDGVGGKIVALSRLPLSKAEDAGIGDYNGPSLQLSLEHGGQTIHILTAHSLPPTDKLNLQRRDEHFDIIADRMNSLPNPKIVIGDLNVTMWSPGYKRLIERTGLINSRKGFGVAPTWPTFLPMAGIPIDHCLVSKDIRVVNTRTGPHIGSDHLPLIVDLEISAWRK